MIRAIAVVLLLCALATPVGPAEMTGAKLSGGKLTEGAAAAGPTCGTGGLLAEDFDGASTGPSPCGSGATTSSDDNVATSCDEDGTNDVDLDATEITGDMFTGEELWTDVNETWSDASATFGFTQNDSVAYIFFNIDASPVATNDNDYMILETYTGGSSRACAIRIVQTAGTDYYSLVYGGSTEIDTYAFATGTFIFELESLEDGVSDQCDWRIWSCSGNDISTCGSSPAHTGGGTGAYFTADVASAEIGMKQDTGAGGVTNAYIGEFHVSSGSTWLCSAP